MINKERVRCKKLNYLVRGRFGELDNDHYRAQEYPEVVMIGFCGDAWRQTVPHDRGRDHERSLPGHNTGIGDMMF